MHNGNMKITKKSHEMFAREDAHGVS